VIFKLLVVVEQVLLGCIRCELVDFLGSCLLGGSRLFELLLIS